MPCGLLGATISVAQAATARRCASSRSNDE
jgi:hypothetical protein